MVATVAAGASAQYYLAQAEYYLGGREPEGRWVLAGPGLGVAAGNTVAGTDFENLHAGRDASGRDSLVKSNTRADRVRGYDITFSAPKSVSLAASFGSDALRATITEAQEEAVAASLRFLDQHGAYCRRGKGGAEHEPVRLTVALFQHNEARPAKHDDGEYFADPALHHHAVIVNIARRSDFTFGALDGRLFFHLKMVAGALYHLELSSRLQRLGFSIEQTGKNGLFELASVDRDLCRYFSARRHEIEDELAAAGIATSAAAPALAAAKARATRGAKQTDGVEDAWDRFAFWRERAAARGFEADRIVDAARQAGRDQATALTAERTEALIRVRVDAVPRLLTETQSVFEHRDLVAALASALIGTGADAARAEAEVDHLVNRGAVVALGHDARWPHAIYSTPDVIALERELQVMAADSGRAQLPFVPAEARVAELIRQAGLNPEQAEAARQATGPNVITIAEGAPGSGKTTLLRPVASAWSEAGWRVIGAATAWKVAHALRDDLGIEARAIESWLAGAEHGRPFLTDKTLLVVDEAGLLSSRQLHRIISEVERARADGQAVALRLVGDRKQLQAIGGPGLRIVADAIGTTRVDTIVRQRERWARDVVNHLGNGRAADALALLDAYGAVEDCAGPRQTVASMIAAWRPARAAQRGEPAPLLIARTNAQVLALNAGVRAVLRADGVLAATDGATLPAVTASGSTYRLGLAVGDHVRFLARLDTIGVVNGTEAILTRIDRADAALRLTARIDGREVVFAPEDVADERGRIWLGHAYASTIYGAQGLTTESALVWIDAGFDRHNAFVAASRARGMTHLFIDKAAVDGKVREARLLNQRSQPVGPEERRATLARLLTRSGERASTLDLVAEGNARRSEAAASSVRPNQRRVRTPRRRQELGLDG